MEFAQGEFGGRFEGEAEGLVPPEAPPAGKASVEDGGEGAPHVWVEPGGGAEVEEGGAKEAGEEEGAEVEDGV